MDPDFRSAQHKNNLKQTPKPNEMDFVTPEQTAAKDAARATVLLPEISDAQTVTTIGWWQKHKLHWPKTKWQWLAGFAPIFVGGIIIALVINNTGSKPVAQAIKPIAAPKTVAAPTVVASTLSGLPVAPSVNQRPVTGVMIENTLDARPQSGLGQAGVVFEAVAEGGITRFLALYQDTAPTNLGPVRSARPYYVEWAMGFDAGYAHVGGSPDALSDIKSWGTRDLDEFANAGAYHRITSREAPHNMYTSMAALNQLEASKGYTSSTYNGFPRKKAAAAKNPTATTIKLAMSGADYNVTYTYNPANNSYNRAEGGAPQIDANTNQQLSPQVVIAIVVPESQGALDASGAYYSDYASIGSGSADIFQDGIETTGQWTKSSPTAQITFTGPNGQSIKLDPGQTWITAVANSGAVAASI